MAYFSRSLTYSSNNNQNLATGNCTEDNYKKDDGKWACGFFLEEGLTQEDAAAKCQALGARLPEVTSLRESDKLLPFKVSFCLV